MFFCLFVCFVLAGPNLIFFNERARGLPSGIVLGQTSRPCVSLDTGLTSAKLHYLADLSPQTVKRIEVSMALISNVLRLYYLNYYLINEVIPYYLKQLTTFVSIFLLLIFLFGSPTRLVPRTI